MSAKDTLSDMTALAAQLEAEGAEIISAGISMVTGPQLHLWGGTLPDAVRERGAFLDPAGEQYKVGYVQDDIKVFWMED